MKPCPVHDCHERGTVKVTDNRRRAPEWLYLCGRHARMFNADALEVLGGRLVEPGRHGGTAPPRAPASSAPSRKRRRSTRAPGGLNKARRVTDAAILRQIPKGGATTREITDGLGGKVGQSAIYQRLRRLADKDGKLRHEARGRVSRWFVHGAVPAPVESSPPPDPAPKPETGATGLAPTQEAPVQSTPLHLVPEPAPTVAELEAMPWEPVTPATPRRHPKLEHVAVRIYELEQRERAIRVELFELRQARAALKAITRIAQDDEAKALELLDRGTALHPDDHHRP